MPDFGTDLSCVSDLDPSGAVVTGRALLGEALARRLTTPRGRLIDDPNYGLDLTEYLNADLSQRDVGILGAQIKAECEKDERVVSADVTALVNINGKLTVTIIIDDGDGPFPLVLAVSDVSASILSVG